VKNVRKMNGFAPGGGAASREHRPQRKMSVMRARRSSSTAPSTVGRGARKGRAAGIGWLGEPEDQDYPAARSYLALTYTDRKADAYVKRLKAARIEIFKAKDLFRASGLSLLGVSNGHVAKDQKRIASGKRLSPLLLVRDPVQARVIIADGYHRLCAVYSYDEDATIPCKIV